MNKYLSLIKFSHTIFAMPFALIGFFLASHQSNFKWETLTYVILCMIFSRSAAMAFNRYIDRDIDTANPRTSEKLSIQKCIADLILLRRNQLMQMALQKWYD